MMKKCLFFVIFLYCLLCNSTIYGQYWCWIKDTSIIGEGGGSQGAAIDLFGNLYSFGSSASVKYILKHKTSDGSVQWAKTGLGNPGYSRNMLTTDRAGNLYAYYDSSSSGTYGITKIDSFGNMVWTRIGSTLVASSSMRTWCIKADNTDHLFICGNFVSTAMAASGDTLYNTLPNDNSFVARYDTSGNLMWLKAVTSPSHVKVFSVDADPYGDVFLAGICQSSTLKIFDSIVTLPIGAADWGIFVAKCDSNGHLLWVTANRHTDPNALLSTSLNSPDYHLGVDESGDAYLAGKYYETDTLGSIPIIYGTADNVFVAKYRGINGAVLWAKTGGNATKVFSLSTNQAGKSYITFATTAASTHFGSSFFSPSSPPWYNATLVGFDSSGNVRCGYMLDGSAGEDDLGVATDQAGIAYVLGDYYGTFSMGGLTFSSGPEKYFLAKYTCNCSCGMAFSVDGGNTMCAGSSTTIASGASGGAWSSTNPSVATVSPLGLITAVTPGTTNVIYSTTDGCSGSSVITVLPAVTLTTTSMCAGGTATITASMPGGTWLSGTTGVATIGPLGVVGAISAGTSMISYSLWPGCSAATVVTVNAAIPPTGASLCTGGSLTLTGSVPGGTWSSSNPSSAAVGPMTGIVTGVAVGTTAISYMSSSCLQVTIVTVNATPGLISGKPEVCEGLSTAISCSPAGGTWSSGSTVASLSSSGLLTGVMAGTAVITYMLPGGCFSTAVATVDPLPVITGPSTIAVGSSPTLTGSPSGGSWTSSDTTKLKVNNTGKITGVAPGTSTVTYSSPAGCNKSVLVTVVRNTSVANMQGVYTKPTLFPNPATNEITIKVEQSEFTSFFIYNALGQEVAMYEINSAEMKMSVKALPPGEYQVILKGNGVREVLRFMKW